MLAAGTRLGAYEIVAPLGAGGMGEVYRARDTKLNRNVAIKVLPTEFSARPDALARFEREAQAVAALSHPNILAIHDFGTVDGVSYAAMELLDGESLRQALADGPLSTRRATEFAIQIARGLAAAHDKGIIHRDLKPENVFITADDRVKILDFGLARHDTTDIAGAGTVAPTQNSPTEPGTVLGTVGYMAPEQVRGAVVDSRADVFSFGAVLYEMVTGQRAFQRETGAETMTAILREDPRDIPPNRAIPTGIDRIIRRCLEKKPEARFRSAHDLAFALEAIADTSATSSITAAPPASARVRRWLRPVAMLILLGLTAATGVWYGRRQDAVSSRNTSAEVPQFRQLTFEDAVIDTARFAPDGRTVVYSSATGDGDPRLFLTRLEFPGATPLPIQNAMVFGVSPDAEMLVGLNPRPLGASRLATLARLPLLGGAPRPVLDDVTFADWNSHDGTLAVVRVVGSEQRLEFPVGNVLFQSQGEIAWPRVSPRGDYVAFLDWPVKDDDRGTVVIVDRNGKRQGVSRSWEAVRGLAWAPSGDQVWYTAAAAGNDYSLRASGLDGKERQIYNAPAGIVLHDIAKDGKALVARYDRTIRVEGVFADQGGLRDLSWLRGSFARDISRDGRRVLLSHFGHGSSPNYDVYVRAVDEAGATRIGEGQGQHFSPDATAVLTVIHGPPSRLVIHPVGPGETKTVTTGDVTVTQARWLGDRRLLIIGTEPAKGVRAYLTDVDGSAPRAITPERITYHVDQIAVSHDGTRVAFRSPEGAITVYSTGGEAPIAAKGFAPAEMPFAWTADDRLLLLERRPSRRLVAVDPTSGRREIVKEIVPSNPMLIGPGLVLLTPDGKSYVANYQTRQMMLFLVEGLF